MSTRFRKRPVVIDAVPWDGTARDAETVITWIMAGGGTASYNEATARAVNDPDTGFMRTELTPMIVIETIEGRMFASAGDWVIRGVQGEHYPCKPEIFEATYESADQRP